MVATEVERGAEGEVPVKLLLSDALYAALVVFAVCATTVPKWAAAMLAFGFGWTASRDLLEWSRR